MSDPAERPATSHGRWPGVFDSFPSGTHLALGAVEVAMAADTELRIVAASEGDLGGGEAPSEQTAGARTTDRSVSPTYVP